MADCPSCGGILKFDIPSQKVKCESCSGSYFPKDIDSTQMAEEMGVTQFICPNCGGEIFSTDRDITGVCSYCGSNVVFESRLVQKRKPDLIIPFTKTKEDCKNSYLTYLGKTFFVPKELKDPSYIDSFRGIYMPLWVTDQEQKGRIRFYSRKSRTTNSIVIEDTYRVRGDLVATYKGIYHDASSSYADDISEKLDPYYVKDHVQPFSPAYLSGFYAEPADKELSDYSEYFQDLTDRQTENFIQLRKTVEGASNLAYIRKTYEKLDMLDPIDGNEMYQTEKFITNKSIPKRARSHNLRDQYKEQQKFNEEWEKAYKETHQEFQEPPSIPERYGYTTTEKGQMAMFPVWFLSWKNGNRVAYATVNGQTGAVCADLPIDLKKFSACFLALFAICFVALSRLTFTPTALLNYAVWFSGIAIHMARCELCNLEEKSRKEIVHTKRSDATGADTVGIFGIIFLIVSHFFGKAVVFIEPDMAYIYTHTAYCIYAVAGLIYVLLQTAKANKIRKQISDENKTFPSYLLSTLAAFACVIVLFSKIPNDPFLYGLCAVAFVIIAASFIGMILQFNKVATRPLPQFSHTGGDDRA